MFLGYKRDQQLGGELRFGWILLDFTLLEVVHVNVYAICAKVSNGHETSYHSGKDTFCKHAGRHHRDLLDRGNRGISKEY